MAAARSAVSRLPIYYFGLAHLSLATAGVFLAVAPARFVGFFYHAQMMAPVHLVTLGWISASILGALYMIAPMALRTRLSEGRLDQVAFWSYAIGVAGMIGHFWIDSYNGLLWSAFMVASGLVVVGVRSWQAMRAAPVGLGVKLHLVFAFVNVAAAATLGILLGFGRIVPVLPGHVLTNVYAHAHLAIFGWATMMVVGVGYRLLPMLLPAAIPGGSGPVMSALLLEGGVVALAGSLLTGGPGLRIGALGIVAALAVFFRQLLWMARHRRPRSRELPRVDLGLVHVGQALIYLVLALVLGWQLLGAAPLEWKLRIAPVYGVCLLLGFLSQMVLGVGARLLPLYAWFRAFSDSDSDGPPASPHGAVSMGAQAVVLASSTAVSPALAAGFFWESWLLVAVGGWLLIATAMLSGGHAVRLLRRLRDSVATPETGRAPG